jgi:hypothetical protein
MRGGFGPVGPDRPHGPPDQYGPHGTPGQYGQHGAPDQYGPHGTPGPETRQAPPESVWERPDASRSDSGSRPIYVWDPES